MRILGSQKSLAVVVGMKKGMDKIWDENPWKSEVIGRCGGYEKKGWIKSGMRILGSQQSLVVVVGMKKRDG